MVRPFDKTPGKQSSPQVEYLHIGYSFSRCKVVVTAKSSQVKVTGPSNGQQTYTIEFDAELEDLWKMLETIKIQYSWWRTARIIMEIIKEICEREKQAKLLQDINSYLGVAEMHSRESGPDEQ